MTCFINNILPRWWHRVWAHSCFPITPVQFLELCTLELPSIVLWTFLSPADLDSGGSQHHMDEDAPHIPDNSSTIRFAKYHQEWSSKPLSTNRDTLPISSSERALYIVPKVQMLFLINDQNSHWEERLKAFKCGFFCTNYTLILKVGYLVWL